MPPSQNRHKLLLLSSLLLEVAGFSVILQGDPFNGMLLVLFGMTFCLMMVFAGSASHPLAHEGLPPDHDIIRSELLADLFRRRASTRTRARRSRRR